MPQRYLRGKVRSRHGSSCREAEEKEVTIEGTMIDMYLRVTRRLRGSPGYLAMPIDLQTNLGASVTAIAVVDPVVAALSSPDLVLAREPAADPPPALRLSTYPRIWFRRSVSICKTPLRLRTMQNKGYSRAHADRASSRYASGAG